MKFGPGLLPGLFLLTGCRNYHFNCFCFRTKSVLLFKRKTPSKLMRKFFKITAISLFILILLAFLLPYLFKDKILVLAKAGDQ
jgi:hypothetical protein